ncbi:hypothetical protein, partial [Nocardia otitidiscaviarum]|uniref:hypothetical protein n=1 Tax=Nocardia otitidiscaviarum TaxID=1823 RepID=UPI002457163A
MTTPEPPDDPAPGLDPPGPPGDRAGRAEKPDPHAPGGDRADRAANREPHSQSGDQTARAASAVST